MREKLLRRQARDLGSFWKRDKDGTLFVEMESKEAGRTSKGIWESFLG